MCKSRDSSCQVIADLNGKLPTLNPRQPPEHALATANKDKLDQVREIFLTQARYCEELGSPFMTRLCRLFAAHIKADDATASRLISLPKTPSFWTLALALRVAGALHALVLTNRCKKLAAVYPPRHDQASDEELWEAISHAMQAHADFFIPFLDSAPQTNEVRRSAVLLPGFLTIHERTGLPFVLSELGASAGINQCWDAFGYTINGQPWGDQRSDVFLAPDWRGAAPPPMAEIEIGGRAACDLAPVNVHDPDAKLRLLSYIWADQLDRFTRTEAALAILDRCRYGVDRANISDWLPQRLALDTRGSVHVIYHTITWYYQGDAACQANQALIEAAGARTTVDAPLAWLRLEPDGKDPGAAILLTLWPDGTEHCLGRADYHGRWIDWQGWAESPLPAENHR
jgi:hypothetical protein